ncbi:polyubiquitin-like isoform X2 [Conger conger]|uniref:polyubiquitin-like isoform X1 n=1 Tax=Conger conger TaxID=82655 RepID=UPI002A5A9C7F|nr:polyubiquitin-like isoform X1 [Conger conger]XP_061117766.1 polyubiquitin-like isoform X2 [Conger conger]
MELTITFLNGKSFPLTAPLHTTVRQLKSMIQECEQVPSAKQRLSTQNGSRIDLKDDSRTLQDYGLHSGCTVVVLITQSYQVLLKNDKNVTHTYDVAPGETVDQFKVKVENKEGVLVQQQWLVYGGKTLEDGQKLEDYGIKRGSTTHLLLRVRGG